MSSNDDTTEDLKRPDFAAKIWRAIYVSDLRRGTSVGSPLASHLSSFLVTTAPLQSAAQRTKSFTSPVSSEIFFITRSLRERSPPSQFQIPRPFQTFRTTILPIVKVPVLSEQISVTPPSASIASRRLTMAFRLAI